MEQRAQDPAPSKGKPPQRGQSDGITPQVLENAVSESRPVDDQTEATDNLSGRPSVVSWNGGFEGPEIFVQGPEGNTRLANDGDFGRRFRTTSNAENSEGVSSVVSVHDLGLGAAPTSPENSFVELAFDRVPGTNFEHLVREKIEQSLRVSKLDNREYLPIDAFEAIFSAKTVDLLMKVTYPELAAEEVCGISRHIMGKEAIQTYRRILGTLVLVKKVSYIKKFLDEEGISDNELPIKRDHSNINIFMARNNTENKTLFRGWERNDIELFYVYQRMLFVPFFNIQQDKLCSYKFDSEIRLPWQYYKPQTSGGNGLVHRVEIHPKHLYFQSANVKPQPKDPHDIEIGEPSERPVYFALKEIFTLDREAYDQELWALQKSFFQKENEKHLVKLLLTFRHGERCYLLFEWADGNLEDFWEGHNRTSIVSDTWAVKQCLGIATAIKRIHGFTTWQKNQRKLAIESGNEEERDWGRHGDIKPRNILWFSSYGEDHHHFVVSDLGLTRFHSRYTRSQVPRSNLDGCTYGYRPPEMDLHNVISQSYDIWSLGCVYMELCLWYVGGIEAVRKFEVEREGQDESEIHGVQEDKYFNVRGKDGQRRAVLKPVVESVRTCCRTSGMLALFHLLVKRCPLITTLQYLEKLLEVQECTPFVREMLNLIREGMLEVDVKKRLKIDRVCAEIQRIKESVAKDEEAERSPDLILRCSLEAERSDVSRPEAYIQLWVLIRDRSGARRDGQSNLMRHVGIYISVTLRVAVAANWEI